MIGTILLDRFEILSLLGEGGMASVYLALDKNHSRQVALKFLTRNKVATEKRQARFIREFSILSKLNHPRIVSVYELHQTAEGDPFFSMEVINGIPLDKKLEEIYKADQGDQSMATSHLLRILEELAEALIQVHSKGIIYCDLKPLNIVLSDATGSGNLEDLKVKLIDFGISRFETDQAEQQLEMGTSLYNSPEQIRGEIVDCRSDIYSFGVTAFEILTGGVPFNASSRLAVTDSHLIGKVPQLNLKNREISPALDRMIRICMKKDKESRYGSMEEVLKRIRVEREASGKIPFIKRISAPLFNFLTK